MLTSLFSLSVDHSFLFLCIVCGFCLKTGHYEHLLVTGSVNVTLRILGLSLQLDFEASLVVFLPLEILLISICFLLLGLNSILSDTSTLQDVSFWLPKLHSLMYSLEKASDCQESTVVRVQLSLWPLSTFSPQLFHFFSVHTWFISHLVVWVKCIL